MSYRPRNRQPRQSATGDRGQTGYRQSRGSVSNVPRHSQLQINTPVSIVLKADQPTGRQVQGFVAEVLTSGDHPHGVKVRLTDGRVGRVQRLASAEDAASSTSTQSLGRNGEVVGQSSGPATGVRTARIVDEDYRNDGYDYDTVDAGSGPSLEDYIVTKAPKRKKGKSSTAVAEDTPIAETVGGDILTDGDTAKATFSSAKSTCPVCHSFEGDEEAVSHHVSTHFE